MIFMYGVSKISSEQNIMLINGRISIVTRRER